MVEKAWGRTLWDQGRRKLGNQGGPEWIHEWENP